MSGLTEMIIDLLRRKKEEEALNQGGQVLPPQGPAQAAMRPALPQGIEPKHGGKTYDDIVKQMGG